MPLTKRFIPPLQRSLIKRLTRILENPVTSGLVFQVAAFQAGMTKNQLVDVNVSEEVASLNDYSGNDKDVTAVITILKPIYTLNAFNGNPAIRFNGLNLLRNTSFFDFSTITIFVVGEFDSPDFSQAMVDVSNGVLTNTGASIFYETDATKFRINDGVFKNAELTESLPAKHIFTGIVDGTNSKLYVDGDLKQTTLAGTLVETLTCLDIGILRAVPSFALIGLLGEVIIYNRALSNSERIAVLNYLSAKWGVALV